LAHFNEARKWFVESCRDLAYTDGPLKLNSPPSEVLHMRFYAPNRRTVITLACIFLAFFATIPPLPAAETTQVLSPGQTPKDRRLAPPKDLNGYFPFTPANSIQEWNKRAEHVRRQTLVSLGLWPLPTRTPLNPVVHGKLDRDDYTVERAYFESVPGFFVTGSLYRPKGKSGKLPGVLCPHGHWSNGRFHDAGEAAVKKEIERGAEKFTEGGRSPLQARCVHLARMGCVVFHYDMLGYADSQQIPSAIAHGYAKQRPEMICTENWGLFSPQAESHFQSIMGLQTWNSIRALDFLSSLPDVDPDRIGVTGASGGGTQTFILGAVDPRPKAAFPAVMVSTAMQGGCTCENACNLRTDTGNIEFAALFGPKPVAMSAADDWTKEMTTKGFPELQQHFKLLGVPDNVFLISRTEFGHNYNAVSREAMYRWFQKHLPIGEGEPAPERDYQRLSQAEMTVWDAEHPQPPGGPDFERKLLQWLKQDTDKQLAAVKPRDADSLGQYHSQIRPALEIVIGRTLPDPEDLEYDQKIKEDRGEYLFMAGLLRNKPREEELPVAFYFPKQWNGEAVIWLHPDGKSSLSNANEPSVAVKQLLAAGKSVVGVDLLYQGEFLKDGKPLEKAPTVANKREAAAYTLGYNPSVFAQRVHDVLTVAAFVKHHERSPQMVSLVGLDGPAGAWAAAARVQAGDLIDRLVIDTGGFRFLKVNDIYSLDFLPGGAKYGDLPGMLIAAAPAAAWVAGEDESSLSDVKAAYQAVNKADQLTIQAGSAREAALTWLLK
jgi:dienelactone hydrolase